MKIKYHSLKTKTINKSIYKNLLKSSLPINHLHLIREDAGNKSKTYFMKIKARLNNGFIHKMIMILLPLKTMMSNKKLIYVWIRLRIYQNK